MCPATFLIEFPKVNGSWAEQAAGLVWSAGGTLWLGRVGYLTFLNPCSRRSLEGGSFPVAAVRKALGEP